MVKPTMSLTLKKDSETHWCLMMLIDLQKRNRYDLLKETYGSLEILINTVFSMGKHCSNVFVSTARIQMTALKMTAQIWGGIAFIFH